MSAVMVEVAHESTAQWDMRPLAEVAEILDRERVPVNAKERETRQGSVPYYGATGQVGWIDEHIFNEELVLLGEDGAPFLEPNKAKAFAVRGKSWVNNHAHVLRARAVPTGWLASYLNSISYEGLVTGTTRLKLTQAAMRRILVPVAPWHVMERTVAELEKQFSRLDEAVANLKRVKANLKRYKAAVLRAAVDGGIQSASGTEAEASKEWNWATCGHVIKTIEAGASFKCIERPPRDGEVGVVKVSAVTWGTFDENESKTCSDAARIKETLLIKPGDFLFSRANTIELVGACVVAQHVTKPLMLSDKILRIRLAATIMPEWLLICLRSKLGRSEIERLATGNQESMRNIGQDRIRQIRLPLPPLPEQHRIVAEVDRQLSISREVEAEVDRSLTRSAAIRLSVLSEAFRHT